MKTSFTTAAIAFAAIGLAAPTTESRQWPYSIDSLSLKHLIESDTFDMTWTVTSRGPTGEDLGSTSCHTAWYVNMIIRIESIAVANAVE